ncbi:hypothetical protein RJ55_05565 [Drechmeria coniospora]|nr:hypothetical protein RJ55_05565 [Drechmeria coniospora]
MPPALGRTRVGHHFTGVGVAAARVQVGVEIMSMPVVLTLSRAACLPYGHGQVSRRKGTWDTTATEKDLEGDSGNHLRGPGPVDRFDVGVLLSDGYVSCWPTGSRASYRYRTLGRAASRAAGRRCKNGTGWMMDGIDGMSRPVAITVGGWVNG